MHAIKRINFAREHPDWRFQHYETLAPAEAHNLGDRLAAALGLARPADAVQFAHALDAQLLDAPGIGCDAQAESFDLLEVFGRLDIRPLEQLYIDWVHFQDVDCMTTHDLVKYFPYLWYPGPDEIDLFDESFAWIVSISASGRARYWRTREMPRVSPG